MPMSLNAALQKMSLVDKPPAQRNLFAEKLYPIEQPIPRAEPTTPLRWMSEAILMTGNETIKIIRRAEPRDAADTINFLVHFPGFVYALCAAIDTSLKEILASQSLPEASKNFVIALCKIGIAFMYNPVSGIIIFNLLHHLPRKIQPIHRLLNANTKPAHSAHDLHFTQERHTLTASQHRTIKTISTQLANDYPELPSDFIHLFCEEVCLGNWQLNHAFEAFNHKAPGEFTDIIAETKNELSANDSTIFENALQHIKIDQLKPLLNKLPKQLQQRVYTLLDYRSARNCACFLSRAVREQRLAPSSFEKSYLNTWIKEYQDLHSSQPTQPPYDLTDLVKLMKTAMQSFADHLQAPTRVIKQVEREIMPASVWPKKLEQQLMQGLNKKHAHTLHNIKSIPRRGRAILAFNHSLFTLDISMALQKIRDNTGRESNMVIDEALHCLPIMSGILESLGYRLAEKSLFARLLSREHLMAVAPGGAREYAKPYSQANTLMWNKARGFVRAHIVSGAPLINIMSPQADHIRHNKLPVALQWMQDNVLTKARAPILPMLLAPPTLYAIKVDHYASEPFEAAPLPANNLDSHDSRFCEHVNETHARIFAQAQAMIREQAPAL